MPLPQLQQGVHLQAERAEQQIRGNSFVCCAAKQLQQAHPAAPGVAMRAALAGKARGVRGRAFERALSLQRAAGSDQNWRPCWQYLTCTSSQKWKWGMAADAVMCRTMA
jgi:hypothetical protein